MQQLQKLHSKLDDILPQTIDAVNKLEPVLDEREEIIERKTESKSQALVFTDMIISKMPYATEDQKHKASQITLHLIAKLSENPKIYQMFTDKVNIANSARIVTILVNLDLPFSSHDMYYLVPYKNNLSLQISYLGMLEIAYRAGVYNVQAKVVYVDDEFDFGFGNSNFYSHRPKFKSKIPAFYYATAKIASKGSKQDAELLLEVMSQEEMLVFKSKYSKPSRDLGKPNLWDVHFEEMAKKTVLKRILKLCPKDRINLDSDILEEGEDSENG